MTTTEINDLGNFGTTVEEIRVDLDEPNTTAAKDRIKLFICRSCERHRTLRLRHLRYDWQLQLRSGIRDYDLRVDFDVPLRSIEGDLIHFLEDGATDVIYDVRRADPQRVKSRRQHEELYRGNPTLWCVEGGILSLDPIPSAVTGDLLVGRGFKIPAMPARSQASGTWSFSPDNFTSEWFTSLAELINAHVRYKMLAGPLRNHEDAQVAAGEYEEILRVLLIETEEEEMPPACVPYFPMM